jgi:dihydrolipoamide dehydrogenase
MKHYDVIVIGSGAGLDVLDNAVELGLKAALVDRGPVGGTCLNLGCIPSKLLIFPADRIMEIREAARLGVEARVESIDFPAIMKRRRQVVHEDSDGIRRYLESSDALDFYDGTGEFIAPYTLRVGSTEIKAEKIFIAAGTRPAMPPIQGLDKVDYLTNETLLELDERPDSLVIIGGGYIGVEFAHFFEAMGTRVTLLEMRCDILTGEEPEIIETVTRALRRRMEVITEARITDVASDGDQLGVIVNYERAGGSGAHSVRAQKLLVATGRVPNSDLLKVKQSGIETDEPGFIRVNEHLETGVKGIYAFGDINGREQFTHTAHAEAAVAAANGLHGHQAVMDYQASPHAVFTHPQIGSVGLTEAAARKSHTKIMVGRADYKDTALGTAMMDDDGFAKIILEQDTGKILGAHIVGPWASVLVQEVVNAMANEGGIDHIASGIHIHPALSELVLKALSNAVPE